MAKKNSKEQRVQVLSDAAEMPPADLGHVAEANSAALAELQAPPDPRDQRGVPCEVRTITLPVAEANGHAMRSPTPRLSGRQARKVSMVYAGAIASGANIRWQRDVLGYLVDLILPDEPTDPSDIVE